MSDYATIHIPPDPGMLDTLMTTFNALPPPTDAPIALFNDHTHALYWVGSLDTVAFRCNSYLIVDQDTAILVDPGSRLYVDQVKARVAQIIDPTRLTGLVCCHQDPDVAASLPEWLNLNPDLLVYTSPRTHLLLPHYGIRAYRYYDIEACPYYPLPSGHALRFLLAPFMHFAGAFTTYDTRTGCLCSGDIWGALTTNWTLFVKDFEEHILNMNLFNLDYLASNKAAKGYVKRLAGLPIHAILPQHGSIIGPQHVPAALDYLAHLQCGLDLIYPDEE